MFIRVLNSKVTVLQDFGDAGFVQADSLVVFEVECEGKCDFKAEDKGVD